jgi:hypothetical protein
MAKEQLLQFEGLVTEMSPDALFATRTKEPDPAAGRRSATTYAGGDW